MVMIMNLYFMCILIKLCYCAAEVQQGIESSKKVVVTPKIYSNMLIRRREEQKNFVKNLLKSDYEKTYKLIDIAFEKILEIIKDNNATLYQSDYNAKAGFPEDEKLQSAVTLIIENTCLAGEIILHLPDISYRILKKRSERNWRNIFLNSIYFVMEFPHLVQEDTVTVLSLFRQEINKQDRTDDFINPYHKDNIEKSQQPKIKLRKRLKKGPQLHTNNKIEL